MARALRVRLIAIKKEISYAKESVVEQIERLEANPPTSQGDYSKKKAKLEVEYLRFKAQLNRAHLYGRLFSGDVIFRCIRCFVLHDVTLNMTRTKSVIPGIKRYRCQRCGDELNGDEPGIS